MKNFLLIILLAFSASRLSAQTTDYCDSLQSRPSVWAASGYTIAINGAVWAYDRYIQKSEFAKINANTIKNNFNTGFVWDSDRLATNHLGHPFNGGLYFLASRMSGFNFWQSLPFSTAGSLIWELFAEKEPPGFNDLLATSLTGAAFGEVMHRGLDYVLHRNSRSRFPLTLNLTLGDRFMADGADITHGGHYPTLSLDLEYGDAFDASEDRPFDYFFGSTTMHLGSSNTQPLFGAMSITGRLWGKELETGENASALFGIWQQYDFYHNRYAREDEANPLFNFSETVAAGPGLMFRQEGSSATLQQALFADIIALGAVENPNLFIIERHYNMGSGFALKSLTSINLWERIKLSFQAKVFYLNTWGNYTSAARTDVETGVLDPLYTDTMGDKGYSWAFVLSPELDINVTGHWGLRLSATRLGRDSRYKYYPDSKARTTEFRLGLRYTL